MSSEPSILIYQSLDKLDYATYQNELVQWLSKKHPGFPFFHVDSFSGQDNFQLANNLLKKGEPCLFVMIFDDQSGITGLSSLLNTLRINNPQQVKVLVFGMSATIHKALQLLEAEEVKNYEELKIKVGDWISAC